MYNFVQRHEHLIRWNVRFIRIHHYYSFIYLFIHLVIYFNSFVCLFNYLFIHSFIYLIFSFSYSFIDVYIHLLSPPNEVCEGTMKQAPYVCVCPSVRPSGLKMLQFASSLSFLGRFWFCLFYLVGLGAGFKTSTQNFEISNYANLFKINEKCYFSVISWPILILFVLSGRAWCRLQTSYTEFWNSLIMQIYANLFKINEKCYFSVISWPILILFVCLIGLGAGFKTSTQNFEIH